MIAESKLRVLAASVAAACIFVGSLAGRVSPSIHSAAATKLDHESLPSNHTSSGAVETSFVDAGVATSAKRASSCCCDSHTRGPQRKCEMKTFGCSERFGSYTVIQPDDLCKIKDLRLKIVGDLQFLSASGKQAKGGLKLANKSSPVTTKVDYFRLKKLHACRAYSRTDWPSELPLAHALLEEETRMASSQISSQTIAVQQALARTSDNSSSQKIWLCCCKLTFADGSADTGKINTGNQGSVEACQQRLECQRSDYKQTTDKHVCELRETMKALQTKARDLASSTVDAEEVYAKYPGWKIRDEARNLRKCVESSNIPAPPKDDDAVVDPDQVEDEEFEAEMGNWAHPARRLTAVVAAAVTAVSLA